MEKYFQPLSLAFCPPQPHPNPTLTQPNPVLMTWEYPVSYDQESKDRIRYMRAKLSYPQEDDDQIAGGIPQTTSNRLDLYMYNSTDEEISNTTGIENDNRDAGDCSSDEYCVWMVIGGSPPLKNF